MKNYINVVFNVESSNSSHNQPTALVIGAGGTARAALYTLEKLGFGATSTNTNLLVWNRTRQRAENLCHDFRNARLCSDLNQLCMSNDNLNVV